MNFVPKKKHIFGISFYYNISVDDMVLHKDIFWCSEPKNRPEISTFISLIVELNYIHYHIRNHLRCRKSSYSDRARSSVVNPEAARLSLEKKSCH